MNLKIKNFLFVFVLIVLLITLFIIYKTELNGVVKTILRHNVESNELHKKDNSTKHHIKSIVKDNTLSVSKAVSNNNLIKTQIDNNTKIQASHSKYSNDIQDAYINNIEFIMMRQYERLILPRDQSDVLQREKFFLDDKNLEKMVTILNTSKNNMEGIFAIEFLAYGSHIVKHNSKDKLEQVILNYLVELENEIENIDDKELKKTKLLNIGELYIIAREFYPNVAERFKKSENIDIQKAMKYDNNSYILQRIAYFM